MKFASKILILQQFHLQIVMKYCLLSSSLRGVQHTKYHSITTSMHDSQFYTVLIN